MLKIDIYKNMSIEEIFLVNNWGVIDKKLGTFTIKCNNNHVFTMPSYKIQCGTPCKQCKLLKQEERKIERFRNTCDKSKQNGGECLSDYSEYKDIKSKLCFKCSCGNIWTTRLLNVLNRNTWCPICSDKRGREVTKRLFNTYNKIVDTAKYRGGCVLIDENSYINNKVRNILIRCKNGHVWKTTGDSVLSGQWCPNCNESDGESLFRIVIEELTSAKFVKIRPKWIIGPKKYPLELDGYNENLKVAFEFQGTQHFYSNSKFYNNNEEIFKYRKLCDKIKKEKCKGLGILLLCPTYNLKRKEQMVEFIHQEFEKNGMSTLDFHEDLDISLTNYTS